MSNDIKIAESFPIINPFKRKGIIQGEFGFGQGDSHSVGEDAEPIQKGRRVESDDVAEKPSSFGMVDQPSVHPGAPFGEDAEELQGDLVVPAQPILSGGYANIYLSIWRSPEGTLTDVAVKTLKPIRPTSMSCQPDAIELQERRQKRLKREVAVWTRLIHPNIHPLLGFRTRPEPCLISPWCRNGDLVDYLYNNPDASRPDKIELLVQVARGLAFLHSQSPPICHADIKPGNVLVNDLCEVALSDFGLSRVIRELDVSTGVTTGDGPKGSLNYMAPELFTEEDSKPTLETDVYAFGGLTLAVMSGSPPFSQINTPAKVMFRILQGIHPKPEEHPLLQPEDPLWSLMRGCWTSQPQMRPIMSSLKVELKKQLIFPSQTTQKSRDQHSRSLLFLHNLRQQGRVLYEETITMDGPANAPTWTTYITLVGGAGEHIGQTYFGHGEKRREVREQVARQVLFVLGHTPPK